MPDDLILAGLFAGSCLALAGAALLTRRARRYSWAAGVSARIACDAARRAKGYAAERPLDPPPATLPFPAAAVRGFGGPDMLDGGDAHDPRPVVRLAGPDLLTTLRTSTARDWDAARSDPRLADPDPDPADAPYAGLYQVTGDPVA